MPQWIVPTLADLNDYLVAAQVNAIRTAALATGQTDTFARVMPAVVDMIRAKIKTCSRNRVSRTVNSVPPELKMDACLLIVEALQGRIPSLELGKGQVEMINRAHARLEKIAKCEELVVEPLDPQEPTDVQIGTGVTLVTSTDRVATPELMDGL